MPRPNRMFYWVGPFVLLNVLLIVVLHPRAGPGLAETISLGFLLGSLFAQASLAAAWTALGTGPLAWRLPLSLGWILLLALAIQMNLALHRGPPGGAVLVGTCLFGQWFLLQIPLWSIALAFGARLRHSENAQHSDPRERQFGIRQLIVVTTVVALLFGSGRLIVPQIVQRLELARGEAPIFIFLGVAAVVLAFPLLVAALLRRFAVPSVLVVLTLIGIATAWEVPLLQLIGTARPGPKVQDFVAINICTAGIMLVVLAMVRLNGYSLTRFARG